MADKTISINFTGADYSPIGDAVKCAEIIDEGVELSLTDKRKILDRFLEKMKNKKLLIGKSEQNKSRQFKIYDPDFGGEEKGYFCGVVGVVSGDITCNYSEEDKKILIHSEFEKHDAEDKEILVHVKLQIQSRMDVTGRDKEYGKPYFLSTLLLEGKLSLNDDTVPNSEDEIFDYLLLYWFREQFREASRKGFYRTYRRFEKNDDRLKGSIDIARHIRLNMGQDNGKIAYSYRENTIDNFLNHMIVAAYECLKKKYYDLVTDNFDNHPDLKADMEFLKREIGYNRENSYELISRNLRPIAHPYYTEYEELRQTCLKILRNEGISIFDSDQDSETNGILFYLPDLWEDYLERKIRESLGRRMGDANQEPVGLLTQETYSVFGNRKASNEEIDSSKQETFSLKQKTRPDYVFYSGSKEHPFMIMDAKFKPKWKDAAFEGTSIGDEILSDYDKCIRDMNTIDAHATGVIFPVNKRNDNLKPVYIHPISKYNLRDCFYTIPVEVPYAPSKKGDQSTNYSSWRSDLDGLLEKPMGKVREFVDNEQKRFLNRMDLDKKIQGFTAENKTDTMNEGEQPSYDILELLKEWKDCDVRWKVDEDNTMSLLKDIK